MLQDDERYVEWFQESDDDDQGVALEEVYNENGDTEGHVFRMDEKLDANLKARIQKSFVNLTTTLESQT